ncbi:MAG: beta-lactamase family protein, partial [Halioglobus sp.]|nr:beta-lactamase family protein [Halioglobus sp.]
MRTLAEGNTQLCIYYRGEKVVDLWASASDDSAFTPDSLVNVFSSGKSLEALAIASLVDKGLLRYDAKIAEYWPEFAANDKQGLSVADLMRHEGGLANFDVSIDTEDLLPENIKQNRVGRIIERQLLRFGLANGNKREYHAITRGWIVNELFRRVDPAGRTVGEYLREEISGPLQADAYIGLKREELARVSPIKTLGFGFQLLQSLIPRRFGRKIVHNIFQILGRLLRILPAIRGGRSQRFPPPYKGMKDIDFFNAADVAMGETPSANANCSARGLAKIAAMLAGGGSFAGTRYLGAQAWKDLHADPVKEMMGGIMPTEFTQGGVARFSACTRDATRFERD